LFIVVVVVVDDDGDVVSIKGCNRITKMYPLRQY